MNTVIRAARLDSVTRVLERARYERAAEATLGRNESLPDMPGAMETAGDTTGFLPRPDNHASDSNQAIGEFAVEKTGPQEKEELPPQATWTREALEAEFADELAKIRRDAFEQGFEDGAGTARAEVEKQNAERLARLDQAITMLGDCFEKDINGLIEIGAEVVFEAVVKIVGQSYMDREGVSNVIREVVRQAKDRSRLLVRVSPRDYEILTSAHDPLAEALGAQHVEFAADDRVELGGCLLETPAGNLDGRLEVQLQQLRDALLNARFRQTESVLEP